MKNNAKLLGLLAGLAIASGAHASLISVSATAPTIDGEDIADLSGTVDAGGDEGHLWSNRPHQGQTFLTGSSVGGYWLNAVTLQNLNNTVSSAPTFNLLVGTVSGTTLTQIGSTETGAAPNYAPGDYITFNLDTPLLLNTNTTYGFLWGTAGQGFVTVNNLDDSAYGDGTAISSGDNNVPDLNNLLPRNVDRVFHLDIAAVPEASEISLFGLSLLGAAFVRIRRKPKARQ